MVDRYFKNKQLAFYKWAEEFPGTRDKIVVHIPARAGSSRIRNKNIYPLRGMPLLAYTIRFALSLPVDRVIVNTDDERYASIARDHGAEVPFLRPPELALDTAPPGHATYYAKRFLMDEGYPVRSFIELLPTTPFRNHNTALTYLERIKSSGHCRTCYSLDVDEAGMYRKQDGVWHRNSTCAHVNGVLFKITSSFAGESFNPMERLYATYSLLTNPIELIDIDTYEDIELAEYVLENDLYDFGVPLC